MLVLEGKSRNRSVSQMGSSKVMCWPPLFSIILSAMLDDAFRDKGGGVYIQSRQSADLLYVAHFRAKTKTTRILMRELLFADDSALVALCCMRCRTCRCFLRYVKEVWHED